MENQILVPEAKDKPGTDIDELAMLQKARSEPEKRSTGPSAASTEQTGEQKTPQRPS